VEIADTKKYNAYEGLYFYTSLLNKFILFSPLHWKNIAMWMCTFNTQKHIYDSTFFHEAEEKNNKFVRLVSIVVNDHKRSRAQTFSFRFGTRVKIDFSRSVPDDESHPVLGSTHSENALFRPKTREIEL